VSFRPAPLEPLRPALLTRVAPVTRLVAGLAWAVVAVWGSRPIVPGTLALAAVGVLALGSGLPLGRAARRLAPILLPAAGLAVLTLVFHPLAGQPGAPELVRIGPLRVVEPAVEAALTLGLRLLVVALVGVLVFAPSDPTRMADSLVEQWRVPARFAYGTLAALRLVPVLGADWAAIGAAHRLRGLDSGGPLARLVRWPRRLLVLLVSAVRRAGRMALAMDARGFDSEQPRSHYRLVRVGLRDVALLTGAIAVAGMAVALGLVSGDARLLP
jgi:energy-coupling factor transport system permease protein